MNHFPSMFTYNVCFAKIIHTATCNMDHVADLYEFTKDFDNKDKTFLIEHAPEAEIFLDEVAFDRADVVDFTDAFRRMQNQYPLLIKLSTFQPHQFQFKEDGDIRSYRFTKERKTQWVLVNNLEYASELAIKFAEQIRVLAIEAEKNGSTDYLV